MSLIEKIKFSTLVVYVAVVSVVVFYINYTFLYQLTQVFSIINMMLLAFAIGTPLFYRYLLRMKVKQIEEAFPKFLRDVTDNLNSGMTLPQAFKTVTNNDYGVLTPYVQQMHAKISFGITFEKVLQNFAENVKAPSMRRNIQMIIETHRSGGTVATVLDAVAESLQELEKIKKQRISSIYTQMINGYIIYIIFLGIMIGLSSFLLPTFELEILPDMRATFVELFSGLVVIQGFFSGISIGKLSEGTLLAGVKHSVVLVVFGWTAFILFG
ncbi:type II secretion system F family protein [Candidatus Aenigmatarchaeota archaeon]